MSSKEKMAEIFSTFGLKYGSRPPHEIADGLLGPELRISFVDARGAGTMIVREKTPADLNYASFTDEMKWVAFSAYDAEPQRYSPEAGAASAEELTDDIVTIFRSFAGGSADAESAVAEG